MTSELKQAIESVLEYQHQWTAVKTVPMEARGELIRDVIPRLLRPLADERGHEVTGSSGAGSNNRVPWVRVFRSDLSPSPQQGWYVVLLFAADGSAFYTALIQGTTEWLKGRGSPLDPEGLRDRSEQARQVLQRAGVDLANLAESIDLRDPGLGRSYEKGTAVALKYEAGSVPPDEIILSDASRMLDLAEYLYSDRYITRDGTLAASEDVVRSGSDGTRSWIFQANPSMFDVTAAVHEISTITWTVRRYRDSIHVGDKVYIWRSGPDAGIVATAVVLTEPALLKQHNDEKKFILKDDSFGEEVSVRIGVQRVVEPALSRAALKSDSRLSELSVLRYSQATNFPVNDHEAAVLDSLILELSDGLDEAAEGVSTNDISRGVRVWVYAPGEQAVYWEEFYREGLIAIGWDELGDLRQYPTAESLSSAISREYESKAKPVNASRACFDFTHIMQPGDRIIVKRGRSAVVGYGVVTGAYQYRSDRSTYKNVRTARWDGRGAWTFDDIIFPLKALTDFTPFTDLIARIDEKVGIAAVVPAPPVTTSLLPYTIVEAVDGIALDPETIVRMLRVWESKKNLILQGPPGVGKTFLARRIAYAMIGHELPSRVGMVQFHQSYSYEDFIQGYRPNNSGFARQDGVFVRFCNRAKADQGSRYVFIIDEINRGNISKVFGELLMLIEKEYRGSKYSISLTYSTQDEEQFYVPENVFLLGLMNTADRSLALVDYALRRRFAFEHLRPMFGEDVFLAYLENGGTDSKLAREVCRRMSELNADIAADANLGTGFCIGHSYLCRRGALMPGDYFDVVRNEIIPLLEEYWMDDQEQIEQWREKLLAPV